MNINLINYTIESKELFLLCRPIGGLNDNLCQIEKCWRYAENFARTLIIDTRNSGGFFGEFSDYFIPQNPLRKVYSNTTEIDSSTNLLITRKLDSYVPIYSEHLHNFIDRKSGKLISFDFDKKYSEPILIHEQCGGGILSFDLLKRVSTSEKLRSIVFDRLKHLINRKYVAIHIRNTDYQTNYESLFKQISPIVVNKSVLVCSDDAQVIKIAKSYFFLLMY